MNECMREVKVVNGKCKLSEVRRTVMGSCEVLVLTQLLNFDSLTPSLPAINLELICLWVEFRN